MFSVVDVKSSVVVEVVVSSSVVVEEVNISVEVVVSSVVVEVVVSGSLDVDVVGSLVVSGSGVVDGTKEVFSDFALRTALPDV